MAAPPVGMQVELRLTENRRYRLQGELMTLVVVAMFFVFISLLVILSCLKRNRSQRSAGSSNGDGDLPLFTKQERPADDVAEKQPKVSLAETTIGFPKLDLGDAQRKKKKKMKKSNICINRDMSGRDHLSYL